MPGRPCVRTDAGARVDPQPRSGLEVPATDFFAVDGDPVEATQPSVADVFDTMILGSARSARSVTLTTVGGKEERMVKVMLRSLPRLAREDERRNEHPQSSSFVSGMWPGGQPDIG